MTQREFERALVKVLPTVTSITYYRRLENRKFFCRAVFVHWGAPEAQQCHLEQHNDMFAETLKFFTELSNASK